MKRYPSLVSGAAVLIVTTLTAGFPHRTQLSAAAFQREHGQGDLHRDDPCDQLPDPPGEANGIDKKCAAGGSSSGIAKGDFNGDGFADLAVGVPGEDTPNNVKDSGAVNVIYGSGAGLTTSTTVVPAVPAPQFWSQNATGVPGISEAGDAFGSALAAGDFNDDGYSDLAVGIPGDDVDFTDSGAVIVIYGSRNGLTATDPGVPGSRYFSLRDLDDNCVNATCLEYPTARLGSSLAWGDFNGDGVGDLGIGAPLAFVMSENLNLFGSNAAGLVWVLTGTRDSGLDLARNRLWFQSDVGEEDFEGGDQFGSSLTSGDFDGDGFFDLAVGAPGEDAAAGQVDILFGASVGLAPDFHSQVLAQGASGIGATSEAGDQFGAAVTAGDFNGDGRADLAVGSPGEDIGAQTDTGLVHVIYGSSDGLTASGNRSWEQNSTGVGTNESGDQFGATLSAGDFNGDGRTDLAIGVPLEDVNVNRTTFIDTVVDAGEVDVIYGSSSGLSITGRAPQVWHQASAGIADDPQEGDHFGASLTAWNFGRNEFVQLAPGVFVARTSADLAIGVPYEDLSGIGGAGAVNVIYGSFVNGGLTSSNNQFWTQGSAGVPGGAESGDHFGAAVY